MLTDTDGAPLALAYAARLADHLNFAPSPGNAQVLRRKCWFPPSSPATITRRKKTPYTPHIEATNSEFCVQSEVSSLRVYTSSGDIHCRMLGEAILDDWLFDLRKVWAGLPHVDDVMEAIIAQADFLDANPMYRGLPKVAARHIPPSQTEV